MKRLIQWRRHALELDHSPSKSVCAFVTRGYCDAFGVKYVGPRCLCKTCERQWRNLDRAEP